MWLEITLICLGIYLIVFATNLHRDGNDGLSLIFGFLGIAVVFITYLFFPIHSDKPLKYTTVIDCKEEVQGDIKTMNCDTTYIYKKIK